MNQIEVSISFLTNEPEDFKIQNELINIHDDLRQYDAELIPLDTTPIKEGMVKKSDVNMIFGSVQIILPAGAFIAILTSFIKNYFQYKNKRGLKITNKDGTIIEISGYNGVQTEKILSSFIENSKITHPDKMPHKK